MVLLSHPFPKTDLQKVKSSLKEVIGGGPNGNFRPYQQLHGHSFRLYHEILFMYDEKTELGRIWTFHASELNSILVSFRPNKLRIKFIKAGQHPM